MLKQNHNPNQFSFNNQKISKHLYTQENSPQKNNLCKKHKLSIGRHFCNRCLTYNLCEKCIELHAEHKVDIFSNELEAKEATRETLLLEVQQTLNRLKGRENELKNQVQEVTLIREKIRVQANELIDSLRKQFDHLQQKLSQKIDYQFQRYEKQLNNFYRQYNSVNDYLRENLLQIIDGDIDFTHFSKENISKDIDIKLMPNFGKVKQVMEKCKKYIKNVKSAIGSLENSIRYFSSQQQKSQTKFDKYDKFLKDNSNAHESDYNSPLLRTLNVLQNQSNLNFLKSKLRS